MCQYIELDMLTGAIMDFSIADIKKMNIKYSYSFVNRIFSIFCTRTYSFYALQKVNYTAVKEIIYCYIIPKLIKMMF